MGLKMGTPYFSNVQSTDEMSLVNWTVKEDGSCSYSNVEEARVTLQVRLPFEFISWKEPSGGTVGFCQYLCVDITWENPFRTGQGWNKRFFERISELEALLKK